MVRRSLLAKTSLYGILVFAMAIPASSSVANRLREAGRGDHVRDLIVPQLKYLKEELETGRPPDAQTLKRLEAPFSASLRFVPWGSPDVPPGLQNNPWTVDPRPLHEGPTHWFRLEGAERPLGAVAMQPHPPGAPGSRPRFRPPHHRGPVRGLLLLIFLLLLAIVPPLYLWVIKPLRAMVTAAQRLGAGDLNTPIPRTRRDEFGELEQAFEHMRQELKRSIEQRERLLTDVSHEIRGPLARMTLALPLMKKEGVGGPISEIFAQEIKAVDHLVGETLALAREGYAPSATYETLDLGVIFEDLIGPRSLWIQEKTLQLSKHFEPAAVRGDRQLLARALGNLLDNALKYSSLGDTLEISTGHDATEAWGRIQDSGPGISPEHLALVFEPFYRPDDSRSRETGGAGLGLSIVKRIIEDHGGSVTLHVPPTGGTCAEIRLPLAC